MLNRKTSPIAVLALAALALVGCSAPQVESKPAPAAPVAAVSDTCAGMPGMQPRSDDDENRVFGYIVPELKDTGSAPAARGETVLDDNGQPAAYVVADGDALSAIADRFCIDHTPYLEWINSIRRNGAAIYPGDTLNLNPTTIATVGDERGVVYDNVPEFHIPPQK